MPARPEATFWSQTVRPNLIHFGVMRRIENLIGIGDSDVIYCLRWLKEPARAGWIELKRLREWPARQSTRIFLPHFSVDQATFLETWGRAGTGAWLLAQVDDSFLLWKWTDARAVQSGLRRNEFCGLAKVNERGKFPTARILRCLTSI